ncbi:MAG: alpha/beta fold hydrolase [Hyphomicrobiales bacterium]|nr:alpha/beta fold hydrolase [Hyphomicrobiales bacterium]
MRQTIVFVPGFNCTAALWAPQIAAFSDRYDCRIADHTKSDTMSGVAQDVLRAAPEQFLLCGLSMGGYIAFEIMRQAPGRVLRLALLDTQATPESEQQKINRAERIRAAREGGMLGVADLQWSQLVHPARYEDEHLRSIQRKMAVDTGFEAFMRQALAIMHRPDSRPGLADIACPTLVLTGQQDQLTPPEKAREMADGIAGAKLVVLPDCGHLSTIEKPRSVNAVLAEWAA